MEPSLVFQEVDAASSEHLISRGQTTNGSLATLANARHLGHHRGTNACGQRDNSNPASQDRERCGVQRHQEYNCSSTENSRHQLTINRYRLTDNHYVLTETFHG